MLGQYWANVADGGQTFDMISDWSLVCAGLTPAISLTKGIDDLVQEHKYYKHPEIIW